MTRALLRPAWPATGRSWRSLARAAGLSVLVAGALTAAAVLPAGAAQARASSPAAVPASAMSAAASSTGADPIAHDPTMVKEGGWYYAIITGDSGAPHTYLPMKRSRDLKTWQELGPVFSTLPAWVPQALGVTPADAWAPDLSWQGDHWALYYAASQFGTNNSVMGLATTRTLDPSSPKFGWVDQGLVVRSTPGVDTVNAIDPEHVTEADGKQWLAYGSFWDGIVMRRLDPATGKLSTTDTAVRSLASRGGASIEGPSIVRHGDYYYLFVMFDYCCRGTNGDYRVMVGRSTNVTGPYVDAAGVPMMQGGGTEVLRGYNEFVGTGGIDIYDRAGSTDMFVNHYYDANDGGAPKLQVRTLSYPGGWPSVSDPLTQQSRSAGHGDAYVKIVNRGAGAGVVVEDNGCGYEGANIGLWTDLGNTCQQWQVVNRGDGYSSILNHFSNKIAEVAACDNVDGGNVAQYGWIGFLPNNDCQRWAVTTDDSGWSTIASKTPGARVMEAAGCGTTAGTNVQIWTSLGNACQQFRFQPVGDVQLADPAGSRDVLDIAGCSPGGPIGAKVAMRTSSLAFCSSWQLTPAGDASYVVTNANTGGHLAPAAGGGVRAVLGDASTAPTWTLHRESNGTWTLVSAAEASSVNVRLVLP